MKSLSLFVLFILISFASSAQTDNPNYDKALAEKLGADDYGMRPYVMAILKTGTNTTALQSDMDKAFRGHLDKIGKMAKEGKLVVAGPLVKNDKTYRGIYIFNVKTLEEAQKLIATDPAITEKLLEAELYIWYGSAALPEYLKVHDKIEKKKP